MCGYSSDFPWSHCLCLPKCIYHLLHSFFTDTYITLARKCLWTNNFTSSCGLFPHFVWQHSPVLWTLVTIPTAAGRDPLHWPRAPADACKWVVCCLKYVQENVLSLLSTAFKTDVSLYYLSNLTYSHQKMKCFISFERSIFRRQRVSLQPLKRDCTSLPCCCECQTSAQTHEPPFSSLHHSPGCVLLQHTPREGDSQEVPEHSRKTVNPSRSFTGSVLWHGLSTCNWASAEWHGKHLIITISTFDHISDTSMALSTSF